MRVRRIDDQRHRGACDATCLQRRRLVFSFGLVKNQELTHLDGMPSSANIVSGSIGGVGGWSIGDVLTDCVNALSAKGLIFILAAGNEGEVNQILHPLT